MAIQLSMPAIPGKKSGAGIGSLIGTGLGVIAAPFTGGASIGIGNQIGGAIGNAVSPGEAGTQAEQLGQAQQKDAVSRRLEAAEKQGHLSQLRESAMALAELPTEQRHEYGPPILDAYAKLRMG